MPHSLALEALLRRRMTGVFAALACYFSYLDSFIDKKTDNMTMNTTHTLLHQRIVELEVEHRDLDAVIETLVSDGRHEELQLRRLKKRKLQLKDNITLLKMQLVPDIPA